MTDPQIAKDVRQIGLKDNDSSRQALADLFIYVYEMDTSVRLADIVSRLAGQVRQP